MIAEDLDQSVVLFSTDPVNPDPFFVDLILRDAAVIPTAVLEEIALMLQEICAAVVRRDIHWMSSGSHQHLHAITTDCM